MPYWIFPSVIRTWKFKQNVWIIHPTVTKPTKSPILALNTSRDWLWGLFLAAPSAPQNSSLWDWPPAVAPWAHCLGQSEHSAPFQALGEEYSGTASGKRLSELSLAHRKQKRDKTRWFSLICLYLVWFKRCSQEVSGHFPVLVWFLIPNSKVGELCVDIWAVGGCSAPPSLRGRTAPTASCGLQVWELSSWFW